MPIIRFSMVDICVVCLDRNYVHGAPNRCLFRITLDWKIDLSISGPFARSPPCTGQRTCNFMQKCAKRPSIALSQFYVIIHHRGTVVVRKHLAPIISFADHHIQFYAYIQGVRSYVSLNETHWTSVRIRSHTRSIPYILLSRWARWFVCICLHDSHTHTHTHAEWLSLYWRCRGDDAVLIQCDNIATYPRTPHDRSQCIRKIVDFSQIRTHTLSSGQPNSTYRTQTHTYTWYRLILSVNLLLCCAQAHWCLGVWAHHSEQPTIKLLLLLLLSLCLFCWNRSRWEKRRQERTKRREKNNNNKNDRA